MKNIFSQTDFNFNKTWIVYILLFLVYFFLMPRTGHEYDMWCWQQWSKHDITYGFSNAYKESGSDYLPLFHYFLYAFGKFQGTIENIEKNRHYIKIFPMIFDFIGGFFLVKLIQDKYKDKFRTFFYSLFLFLNIAYFYNSIIWGQVDGMMTAFIFIAFFYSIKEKVLPALIMMILALNFKVQSIIFLPLFGLILLPAIIKKFSWKNLSAWLLIPLLIQLLILWPFLITNNFDKVWAIVINSVGKYPEVSMNAYNMWYWLIPGDLRTIHDTGIYLGLTYKNWGLLVFFAVSFVTLFPLIKDVYSILVRKSKEKISPEKIMLTAALLPLVFFFFNTEMHERYSHPAILFIAAYSLLTKRFLPYIFVSAAYLLNMEGVLKYLQLHKYSTLIFDPRFVALLFLITIVLLFDDLLKGEVKSESLKHSVSLANN
jgi:Gpi18-like mannosyltransferase